MSAASRDEAWLDSMKQLIVRRTGLSRVELRAERLGRFAPHAARAQEPANDQQHWDELIDEITVRETYFFRHAEHFDMLRNIVLPEIRARRGPASFLRAWCAGCASGEEPYTIAIVLAEEGLIHRASIVGTDLSRAAIESARNACYRPWSLRELSPELTAKHFERTAGLYKVRAELRSHVTFRQLNLAEDRYPSLETETLGMQLIFCRNVMMFLDTRTRTMLAERLFAALEPGGWLFTGPSDPSLSELAPFEAHVLPGALVYRRPLRLPPLRSPSTPLPSVLDSQSVRAPSVRPPRVPSVRPAAPVEETKDVLDEITELWNGGGPERALELCVRALEHQPEALPLNYLRGLLLWELRRLPEATQALRSVLYLDRSHALAHFGLASIQASLGESAAARRSYRNVLSACAKQPPERLLPQGDGLSIAGLRRAAEHGLRRLPAELEEP